ncbi:glycosyltransferase [Fibrobacter succinogenes]|uniref:glycosyltransferase n=1 Tax=Fibrobacter succinogenes TaxID=833 RepID=UPI0015681395|nr:glycosyltransferase [Fibrobacter succinogenes]
MKVLVIGSVYPRFQEDAEVPWLRTSVAHLKKAGIEIQVLAPAYKGLKSHDIDGTHVNRFRYAPANWEILTHEEGAPSKMASKPWLQLLAIPYIINGFFQCIRICRKWRPDVIHAHWPFPHAYIALGAAKLFRIPLVLNFHGAELLLIRKKKWVKPLLKFAIGQAQAIFANSSFTAGKIKALRNVDVEWSPYGTTLETRDESNASCHPERNVVKSKDPVTIVPHPVNGKFKILFVGRHIERKGICYLIEAAKYLPRDKFEIRIVGVGDLTEQLKQQAALLDERQKTKDERDVILSESEGSSQGNQPADIIFTGKLSPEDLANEYKTANVFVLPAIVDHKGDTEGLGVVLIEAMELGLPIVASNVGGIPDVVVDGKSGILVPEKDPVALADAFKRLEADATLIQKLLAGARKRIEECFTWDGIIERQIEVYKRLQQ